MHDGVTHAAGRARVRRGDSLLARIAAATLGLPATAEDVAVSVSFTTRGDAEIWTRTFGPRRFSSVQSETHARDGRHLSERFGPVTFAIALRRQDERLWLDVRGWSVFGVPLPGRVAPKAIAYESVEDGRFCFYVDISAPFAGRIVCYEGWLSPARLE